MKYVEISLSIKFGKKNKSHINFGILIIIKKLEIWMLVCDVYAKKEVVDPLFIVGSCNFLGLKDARLLL